MATPTCLLLGDGIADDTLLNIARFLPTARDPRSCGDAPPWRVRPGRRAVGRNSRSPQVGPGTPC